jgi:hypothetical protein
MNKLLLVSTIVLVRQVPAIADSHGNFWEINTRPLVIETDNCQFKFDKKVNDCTKFVVTKSNNTLNYHFDVDEVKGITFAFLLQETKEDSTGVVAKARYMSIRNSHGINTYPGMGECKADLKSVSCSFTGAKGNRMLANARFQPLKKEESRNHRVRLGTSVSNAAFLNGTWEGSYTCHQGLTRLKLVIDAKSTTDIDAVFMFSAHPQNPNVPSGRFRMEGTLETFNSPDIPDLLDLKGTAWMNQPSGWIMVDLRGDVSSSKQRIVGNVPSPGCSTFEVTKKEL